MYVSFPEYIVKIIARMYVDTLESLATAHVSYNNLSLVNTFVSSKGTIACIGLQPPKSKRSSDASRPVSSLQ